MAAEIEQSPDTRTLIILFERIPLEGQTELQTLTTRLIVDLMN